MKNKYGETIPDHECEWGSLYHPHFGGAPVRKCEVCGMILALEDEDDDYIPEHLRDESET